MSSEDHDHIVLASDLVAASQEGDTEVTCRPNIYCLAAADILVENGVCRNQSEAIAWLCEGGLASHRTLFFRALEKVAEDKHCRQAGVTG
jgi:hypothetical protein